MVNINKNNRIAKLYTFFIVVLPILHQYASPFPGVTLGEFFLLLFCPILLIEMKKINFKPVIYSPLFIYLFWVILGGFISSFFQIQFDFFSFLTGSVRLAFYVYLVLIGRVVLFNLNYGFKIYRVFVLLATFYLILQTIFYNFFSIILPWYINFIPLYVEETYKQVDFNAFFENFYRPYSFFLEPGYYAQYVLPYFIYSIFGTNHFHKILRFDAAFLSVGLIISTSGQGILMCGLMWSIWFSRKLFLDKNSNKILVFFSLIGFISLIPILFASERFQTSIDRLFDSPQASANTRINQGFEWFWLLDSKFKLIGVGYNNLENILMNITMTDFSNSYSNSIAFSLICTGIIGLVIITYFFLKLYKNTKYAFRYILLSLLILSFASGIFNGASMVLYLSIILCGYRKDMVDSNIKTKISSRLEQHKSFLSTKISGTLT
jgi:hypothetical protein